MLMVDSITRLAHAQREIGLSMNEPPTTRGYPPSVFSMLPQLLERSGSAQKGTITAFYNVLVDGDDLDEPITDAVRGILDGHIALARAFANKGHYPAIDINASISRLMDEVATDKHIGAARKMKRLYSAYREQEALIALGAYQKGSMPEVDEAIRMKPEIDRFLMQGVYERADFDTMKRALLSMFYSQKEVGDEMGDVMEPETMSETIPEELGYTESGTAIAASDAVII